MFWSIITDDSPRFLGAVELVEDKGVLLDMMRDSNIISIAGKESIKLAMDAGILDKDHIKKIAGIPYAQIVFD